MDIADIRKKAKANRRSPAVPDPEYQYGLGYPDSPLYTEVATQLYDIRRIVKDAKVYSYFQDPADGRLYFSASGGAMVPPPTAAVVSWNCVSKLAVMVPALAGAVMVWLMAPLSDQLLKTNRVPVEPACGVVVAMVWFEPGVTWNVCGAVKGVPSKIRVRPAGDEVMVSPMVAAEYVAVN